MKQILSTKLTTTTSVNTFTKQVYPTRVVNLLNLPNKLCMYRYCTYFHSYISEFWENYFYWHSANIHEQRQRKTRAYIIRKRAFPFVRFLSRGVFWVGTPSVAILQGVLRNALSLESPVLYYHCIIHFHIIKHSAVIFSSSESIIFSRAISIEKVRTLLSF